MILFFTDFGLEGPYLGQMQALVASGCPGLPYLNLQSDAPVHNPRASAYLLAAYASRIPEGAVTVAVVDPGVGGTRRPIIVKADGRWYVGPDNGLLDVLCLQAQSVERWSIVWVPEAISSSFHGRDLFTPVAIGLWLEQWPEVEEYPFSVTELTMDLPEVVYIDYFGNLFTGLRASAIPGAASRLLCGGMEISPADTFSQVQPGELFWYVNSNGLAEIAANQGRAEEVLQARIGTPVEVL